MRHPDVKSHGKDDPRNQANPQIQPVKREEIAPQQRGSTTKCLVHPALVLGHGDYLRHIKPHANADQQEQKEDGGGFDEMHRRHRRDRLLVDAVVDVMGDSAENENGNENDQEANCQADKTPEMVAASFEERASAKPLSGIVSSQNSARGENHENGEEDCTQEGCGYRSAKWKFGIHCQRAEGSQVESV